MAEVVLDSPSTATLSRPSRGVWVITMERKPDNRLAPEMLQLLLQRLDEVEREWRMLNEGKNAKSKVGGALILASNVTKFFSNGFIPQFLARPGFKDQLVNPLLYRTLTFPLVTIAAINGHSMACDFRIMTSGKGWMSMNEVLIGLPLQQGTCALLSSKISPRHWRDVTLGRRWTSAEAKDAGLIDEVVDTSTNVHAVMRRAVELAEQEGPKVAQGTWGAIKDGMYHWVGEALRNQPPGRFPHEEATAFFDRLRRQKARL